MLILVLSNLHDYNNQLLEYYFLTHTKTEIYFDETIKINYLLENYSIKEFHKNVGFINQISKAITKELTLDYELKLIFILH